MKYPLVSFTLLGTNNDDDVIRELALTLVMSHGC